MSVNWPTRDRYVLSTEVLGRGTWQVGFCFVLFCWGVGRGGGSLVSIPLLYVFTENVYR